MIVKFFKGRGTGSGSGAVGYLIAAKSPDGTLRMPPPEVLRGDPELVRRLIDSLDFTRRYKPGVLSFAPGEVITPEMEEDIMDTFERVAFAGLEPDQYSILWVRHQHAGHHELHFVVPRVELSTGKSLNIDPPTRGSRELFDTLQSMINARYGLADPLDPARSQAMTLPDHIAALLAEAKRRKGLVTLKGRAGLRTQIQATVRERVRREVLAGRLSGRGDIEGWLASEGYAIARSGEDYLTMIEPATGERIRLKGELFSREGVGHHGKPGPVYGVVNLAREAILTARLEPMVAKRAAYHRKRYGLHVPPARHRGMESLAHHLAHTLGTEAIQPLWPRGTGGFNAAREDERWWERFYNTEDLEMER
jgi:Relaxase/Mobilisation nuclease domain